VRLQDNSFSSSLASEEAVYVLEFEARKLIINFCFFVSLSRETAIRNRKSSLSTGVELQDITSTGVLMQPEALASVYTRRIRREPELPEAENLLFIFLACIGYSFTRGYLKRVYRKCLTDF